MKRNSGITIISLAITIAVMLILVSIVTFSGIEYIKNARNNKLSTELYQVQHAILEQYAMYSSTGNDEYIIGTPITKADVEDVIPDEINLSDISSGENYYELTPEDLTNLKIEKAKDTYIVNYFTGEVINKTKLRDEAGTILYIRGRQVTEVETANKGRSPIVTVVNEPGSSSINLPSTVQSGDKIIFNTTGVRNEGTLIRYTVPIACEVQIEATGAAGSQGNAASTGTRPAAGKGAYIKTEKINFNQGDELVLLVGQKGDLDPIQHDGDASGGGRRRSYIYM